MSAPAVIRAVELKNFGPHEDTYVEFTANETAIRGPNNAGKSQLVKAMLTALFNEDFPADRIRHGENNGSVTVVLEPDGRRLRRSRKGGKQRVELINADGSIFADSDGPKGFDDKVAEFTGFRKVSLDKNDSTPYNLNFLPLGAPPFLIGLGPEKLLRALSTILTGKGVETAKINLAKALKGLAEELKADAKNLASVQERIAYLQEPKWQIWKEKFQTLEADERELVEIDEIIAYLEKANGRFESAPFDEEVRTAIKLIACEGEPALETLFSELADLNEICVYLGVANTTMNRLAYQKETDEQQLAALRDELEEINAQMQGFVCETCHRMVEVIE